MKKITIFMIIIFVILWLILVVLALDSEWSGLDKFGFITLYSAFYIYFISSAIKLNNGG